MFRCFFFYNFLALWMTYFLFFQRNKHSYSLPFFSHDPLPRRKILISWRHFWEMCLKSLNFQFGSGTNDDGRLIPLSRAPESAGSLSRCAAETVISSLDGRGGQGGERGDVVDCQVGRIWRKNEGSSLTKCRQLRLQTKEIWDHTSQ